MSRTKPWPKLKLNLDPAIIDRARRNGRLKAIDLRERNLDPQGRVLPDKRPASVRGEAFLFKGSAVMVWLDAGAPSARPNETAPRGTARRNQQTMSNNVISQFNDAVTAKMEATGLDRRRASLAVARQHPELHSQFLKATNAPRSTRQTARRGTASPQSRATATSSPAGGSAQATNHDTIVDAVSEFGRRVAEKMKLGMTRQRAVVSVAKADPELHHRFVKQSNPQHSKIQQFID